MDLLQLPDSLLLFGSIDPIHLKQDFLDAILTEIIVLHLQIEK